MMKEFAFSEVFNFFNGKAIKPQKGNIPIYGSNGIIGYTENALYENSIILGRVGAYCGAVLYCKNPFWASDNTIVLNVKEDIADIKYCYYLLQTLQLNKYATGSAQPLITQTILKGFTVSLPPIETQKKIADILSAYDDLIENNQKQIKLLEEAAQRLYKEWFIDLHFPGHESTPIIDGIPQGWKKEEFSQVFNFVRGKSYTSQELSEDNGVLMVNLKNIRAWGGYKRNAEKRFIGQYKESQTLEAGDVVMSVTDMTQERRLVGHVAMIPDFNEPATFSMDLIKLLPYEITKNYLYAVLQYGDYGKEISILANGTNVLHLKPEAMIKMKMLIPKNDIISAFEEVFEPIRKQLEILQNQCELAIEARDRLLPKLMNGEIEVSMDKKETVKIDNFDYIRQHWKAVPYDEDLPLAARSTGDISEETLEKLKEIAEEE